MKELTQDQITQLSAIFAQPSDLETKIKNKIAELQKDQRRELRENDDCYDDVEERMTDAAKDLVEFGANYLDNIVDVASEYEEYKREERRIIREYGEKIELLKELLK